MRPLLMPMFRIAFRPDSGSTTLPLAITMSYSGSAARTTDRAIGATMSKNTRHDKHIESPLRTTSPRSEVINSLPSPTEVSILLSVRLGSVNPLQKVKRIIPLLRESHHLHIRWLLGVFKRISSAHPRTGPADDVKEVFAPSPGEEAGGRA